MLLRMILPKLRQFDSQLQFTFSTSTLFICLRGIIYLFLFLFFFVIQILPADQNAYFS